MTYFDIHSHNFEVKDVVVVHSFHASESFEAKNYNQYFTIGIHPWYVDENWKEDLKILQEIAQQNTFCIGLGETGLDRTKGENLSLQEEIFIEHIRISEELELPLILHVVRAYEKILELHKKFNPKSSWIIHDFLSSIDMARQFWKKNIYTSFGESLFISPKIQNVFREAPLELCFLETDESPISIQKIYELAIGLKNVTKLYFMTKIYENFQRVFRRANL